MFTLLMLLVVSGCVVGGYVAFPRTNRRRYCAVVLWVMLIGWLYFPLWSTASVYEGFWIGLLLRLISRDRQLVRYQVTKTVWLFVHLAPRFYRQDTPGYFQAQLGILGIYKEKQP